MDITISVILYCMRTTCAIPRLVSACMLLVAASILTAQQTRLTWSWQTPLPTGYDLTDVQFTSHGNGVVCGDRNFPFVARTTDYGSSWINDPVGYADSFRDITANGTGILFAVSANGPLYTSADDGRTWSPQRDPLTEGSDYSGIVFRNSFGIIYGRNSTVYLSDDDGQTWTPRTIGTRNLFSGCAYIDAQNRFWVLSERHLYRSDDSGRTWHQPLPLLPTVCSGVVVLDNGTVLAIGYEHDVFRWHEGANTWSYALLYQKSSLSNLFALPNGTILLSAKGMFLRSTDDGRTFIATASVSGVANRFTYDGTVRVACCGSNGRIWRSDDLGANWYEQPDRVHDVILSLCYAPSGKGFASGLITRSLFVRKDSLSPWLPEATMPMKADQVVSADGTIVWATTSQDLNSDSLHLSVDGGRTFTTIQYNNPIEYRISGKIVAPSPRCLIGYLYGRIQRTLDTGRTWHDFPVSVTDEMPFNNHFSAPNESTIWTGPVNEFNLARTTNAGATWELVIHSGIGDPLVMCAASADTVVTVTDRTINLTVDGGLTWMRTPYEHQWLGGISVDVSPNGRFAVQIGDALYIQEPGGSWSTHRIPASGSFEIAFGRSKIRWDGNSRLVFTYGYGGLLQAAVSTVTTTVEEAEASPSPHVLMLSGCSTGTLYLRQQISGVFHVVLSDLAGSVVGSAVLDADQNRGVLSHCPALPPGVYMMADEYGVLRSLFHCY